MPKQPDCLSAPVLIVGGGVGGVAAALALAQRDVRCIITEPTDWLGGQLTSQAVPPDENRWIEGFDGVQSAPRSYLRYRNAVRDWYRENRLLTSNAMSDARLNPGNGWVSHLCHEPRIGREVLMKMLRPFLEAGLVTILLEHRPSRVERQGDRIGAIEFENLRSGEFTTITAEYFLEATESGDILSLGKIAHHIGAEHRDVFGEMHGRTDRTDPNDVQAISWCFALEHRADEDHTIAKPERYNFWRDYVPPTTPAWSGRLFDWTVPSGPEHSPRLFRWLPPPQQPAENEWEMWRYRRIVDASLYTPGTQAHPDVALINMAQMDYFLKSSLCDSTERQQAVFNEARELSLCFLYWMQTEAPRFDTSDRLGFPGLKLRGDELGTVDGFAKHPYIREARRLDAVRMIGERDVGVQQRKAEGRMPPDSPSWGIGEPFADSVGVGHYWLDLHPSAAMRGGVFVECAPFRISLSALVPKRTTNLIAAGKSLGVSHIANGCYRLHPIEWNVGESAAHLVAHCLKTGTTPHQVCEDRSHLRRYQSELATAGVPLAWPWEHGANL